MNLIFSEREREREIKGILSHILELNFVISYYSFMLYVINLLYKQINRLIIQLFPHPDTLSLNLQKPLYLYFKSYIIFFSHGRCQWQRPFRTIYQFIIIIILLLYFYFFCFGKFASADFLFRHYEFH